MKIIKSIFLILIFPIGNCYAGWFGPSNYEECILEKMKEAKTNSAAFAIATACRSKFPNKERVVAEEPPQELPSEVVDQLIVKCHAQLNAEEEPEPPSMRLFRPDRNAPQCSLYNGNSEWSIFSLIIRIKDLDSGDYHDFNVLTGHQYGGGGVRPLTMDSPIYLDLSLFRREMDSEDLSAFIVSGKGYKE